MSKKIEIEIDGVTYKTHPSATIIEAADEVGVYIPRFCYHKNLSVVANCRMCLVQVDNVPKPLPACATPITSGMSIKTQSKMAIAAQRAVMEFLLINHPLDCPICDQGGECELQDVSMGYGAGYSAYQSTKRSVAKQDIGALIETDMTRCIQCTRCVRFGEEVAGLRELGATGRGEDMQIGTYVQHFVASEVSGNIIDLCPVGALTSKPYRYRARSWEMQQHRLIAPHDCLGSHVFVHTRGRQSCATREVMRVVPRQCDHLNECWLSDRDRFSYLALGHPDRITKPQLKKNGQWIEVSWKNALTIIATRLRDISQASSDVPALGGLVSPQAPTEDMYLLQRLLRGLGSDSIDYRLRQQDFSSPAELSAALQFKGTLADLDQAKKIFLIGSDIRHEVPLLGLRVRAASLSDNEDADVMVLHCLDYPAHFEVTLKHITSYTEWKPVLTSVLEYCRKHKRNSAGASGLNQDAALDAKERSVAEQLAYYLMKEGAGVLVLGLDVLHHPQATRIQQLAVSIADVSGCQILQMTDGANSAGAVWAGCVPYQREAGLPVEQEGFNAQTMFSTPHRAYWLHGVEAELDCAHSELAMSALDQAEFVVCCHSYMTPAMQDYADIILPAAPWTESAGSFINVLGAWQWSEAASVPHMDSKPGWKILRVLGQLLEFEGFDAKHAEAVLTDLKVRYLVEIETSDQSQAPHSGKEAIKEAIKDEVQSEKTLKNKHVEASSHKKSNANAQMKNIASISLVAFASKQDTQEHHAAGSSSSDADLYRLASWPMYATDAMVRRVEVLQQVDLADAKLGLNQATADRLQLAAGDEVLASQAKLQIKAQLYIDNRLANDVVYLPQGIAASAGFGQGMSSITLERGEHAR